MPLYDFICDSCRTPSTLFMKMSDKAVCPKCGSDQMAKQLTSFSFQGAGSTAAAEGGMAPKSGGGHVHSASCGHGGCGASTYADSLVKKHLG